MIVALRLVIGWHFFKEGSKKITEGDFSSEGFLRQAKGPFANYFRSLIKDIHGKERLSREVILNRWSNYTEQAKNALVFNEEQVKQADKLLEKYTGLLDNFLAENAEDMDEYFLEVDRWDDKRKDEKNLQLSTQADLIFKKENELWGEMRPWITQVTSTEKAFITELNEIADSSKNPKFQVPNPNTSTVDIIVTYLVFGAGICLLLGFATRLASLAAAGFLIQVVAAQWPGAYGADPTYYQAVEVVALLFLAAVGAGRFAGLDYIIAGIFSSCCKPATNSEESS